jgi:exopolysaccharide biosynthesis polyprenyl glycosylphosphotransferase
VSVVSRDAHPRDVLDRDDLANSAAVNDGRLRVAAIPRGTHRRGWLVHRALLVADLAGLLVSFLIAAWVFRGEIVGAISFGTEVMLFVLTLPGWVVLAKLFGLYDRDEQRADHSTVDDFIGVFSVVTVGTWLFFVATQVTNALTPSLGRMITFWLLSFVLVPTARAIARAVCRRSSSFIQNTLVVGTGPTARQVVRKIISHPEYGLAVVGFVDSSPASTSGDLAGISVVGAPDELTAIVSEFGVQRVIVSFTDDGHEATLDAVRELRDLEVQIDIVPRLYESIGTNSRVHMIEGMPLVGLPPLRLSPSSRFLKRSLDIAGAAFGLAVLSPVLLVSAIAVKLDSRGPVLFNQIRRGEKGRVFRIHKLRTMAVDAEGRKSELGELNMHNDDDPRMFKVPNDPRVTGVGSFLRRWSIDELPQLYNVLKGEMSLVGPRPLILEEDEHVLDWRRKRLELRPGMTGVWQVLGASDIPFDEMTKLDYLYVTNWSLKQDVRLILLTIPSLLRRRRAY